METQELEKEIEKAVQEALRTKGFFYGLLYDLEALTETKVDEKEFEDFLSQESYQIEDALQEAWEDWKGGQN